MSLPLRGIHHVTAIAGAPQRTVDFYTRLLGLRLVKVTVNFDDPSSYHLYFGDGVGSPGTILTLFSWPAMPRGRQGSGQITATSFTIPSSSLAYWIDRLTMAQMPFTGPTPRFDDTLLAFADPDGLPLELVASPHPDLRTGWTAGAVPAEHAIRGLHAVTVWSAHPQRTQRVLTETLGFRLVGTSETTTRFALANGEPGALVEVRDGTGVPRGAVAAGTVHHVAWRVASDAAQADWRARLLDHGVPVSPFMDRQYFHSIYFREPGGVLFEIATDAPGFLSDEPYEELGTRLCLPPWLESARQDISTSLPPLAELRRA